MNFPGKIQRYKGASLLPGQVALGSDPNITGDKALDPKPGMQDYVVSLPAQSDSGWPINFVLISYDGPDASYPVKVYAWEGTIGTWQMVSGGSVNVSKGIVAAVPIFAPFGKAIGNMQIYVQFSGSAGTMQDGEHSISVAAGA